MFWWKSRWPPRWRKPTNWFGWRSSLNRIGQVGHLERFNPAVRATAPLITQPMFFEVHRLSIFTPRSLDVDVILDLMIHDLDIVLWLVKSPVKEIRAVGLPILSGKADIANVRLEFESGCVANFTASRVSTERVRKLRFFQPRQYVSLDYGRQEVLVFSVGEAGESAGTPSVNPQIKVASRRLWRKNRCRPSSGRSWRRCGRDPDPWSHSKTGAAPWRWPSTLWRRCGNTARKFNSNNCADALRQNRVSDCCAMVQPRFLFYTS